MRSRTAGASWTRGTSARAAALATLTVTLTGLGQGSAFAATTHVAADEASSLNFAGPVGVGAVALGVVGLLLSLVRQQRRRAEATPGGSPDPDPSAATPAASTVPTGQPVAARAGAADDSMNEVTTVIPRAGARDWFAPARPPAARPAPQPAARSGAAPTTRIAPVAVPGQPQPRPQRQPTPTPARRPQQAGPR